MKLISIICFFCMIFLKIDANCQLLPVLPTRKIENSGVVSLFAPASFDFSSSHFCYFLASPSSYGIKELNYAQIAAFIPISDNYIAALELNGIYFDLYGRICSKFAISRKIDERLTFLITPEVNHIRFKSMADETNFSMSFAAMYSFSEKLRFSAALLHLLSNSKDNRAHYKDRQRVLLGVGFDIYAKLSIDLAADIIIDSFTDFYVSLAYPLAEHLKIAADYSINTQSVDLFFVMKIDNHTHFNPYIRYNKYLSWSFGGSFLIFF